MQRGEGEEDRHQVRRHGQEPQPPRRHRHWRDGNHRRTISQLFLDAVNFWPPACRVVPALERRAPVPRSHRIDHIPENLMPSRRALSLMLFTVLAAVSLAARQPATGVDPSLFADMKWRNI